MALSADRHDYFGVMVVTNAVGPWALGVMGAIGAGVGLLRYRVETEQKSRNAGDRDE
jgi:hypothetical protein